jgi:TolA-binding protein
LESKFFDRNKKPKDWFTQSCLRLSGKYRTKKNEETDPAKKKIYESKQLSFFKRSQRLGGNAPTAYTLAYGELRECFGFKRNKKFAKAKEMYATAIQSFSLIVKRFPGSTEEVKAYKQLGLLHEYFKDLEKSKTMYEECMKRIATPDVAGKVEKIDVMTSLANVHFLSNDYDGTIAALIEIDKYADSEKFKTTDDALIKKIKALEEKRITLNIFSLDNQLIPKKKELRVLKSDLKLNPEDEVLKGKVEATAKEITDGLTKTLTSFKKWLTKFQSSPNCPSVMARLGSLHQELGQSADAKRVYERLKAKYPDHEVVKLISINIVRAHLKNEDQAAAAEALEDTNLQELDDSSLQYLIREFVVEEIPRGMSSTTVKDCSAVAVKVIDILRPRYEKAKKDLNRLHWLDYRKARSLYNLNKLDPAKVILERMAKEKPYGPYIFEAKFLLGAISSKQGDYNTVSGIYASLKALSTRMPEDLNREVRISVEWANAYHDVQGDPRLTKKGRGLAMMTKDMNIEKLDEVGLFQVQKAWYLFIHYSKKMELEISELKKEFLKTYPGSPYAFKVRKL